MATVSSHRVIMRKMVFSLFLGSFSSNPFCNAGNQDIHEIPDKFEIWPDPTAICGVGCP